MRLKATVDLDCSALVDLAPKRGQIWEIVRYRLATASVLLHGRAHWSDIAEGTLDRDRSRAYSLDRIR